MVERLADSSVASGVEEGSAGAGCRPATGLRDAHPKIKPTRKITGIIASDDLRHPFSRLTAGERRIRAFPCRRECCRDVSDITGRPYLYAHIYE